ncbi:NTP transferase domain-containing protein [Streptomyces sp. M10(2022)]
MVERQEPPVFYFNPDEAAGDGYRFAPEQDLCPLSRRVHRFAGLRGPARELARRIMGLASDPAPQGFSALSVPGPWSGPELEQAGVADTDLLITCLGYDALLPRLIGPDGAGLALARRAGAVDTGTTGVPWTSRANRSAGWSPTGWGRPGAIRQHRRRTRIPGPAGRSLDLSARHRCGRPRLTAAAGGSKHAGRTARGPRSGPMTERNPLSITELPNRAIVLAAGLGQRLGQASSRRPKPLTPVAGRPILVHTLGHLAAAGIQETVLVVGHLHELVEEVAGTEYAGMKIRYVLNENAATTNNLHSVWLAREYFDQDVLLLEGDVVFEPRVLERLGAFAGASVAAAAQPCVPCAAPWSPRTPTTG